MASIAGSNDISGVVPQDTARGEAFFFKMAVAMAITVVLGFSVQFLAGRSSFGSPARVHFHGVVFMGWTALFVAQAWLGTRGPIALHRTLGRIALVWLLAMLTTATVVILANVRGGTAPFFFMPQHFLVANPMTLLAFAGLTALAVQRRRDTDWHSRLQIGAMTIITGPAFGRLLPMPLLTPYAFEAAGAAASLFLVVGMVRDKRVLGRIHPAWWVSLGVLVGTLLLARLIAFSPVGDALYAAVVAGYPGEHIPGLALGTPPPAP